MADSNPRQQGASERSDIADAESQLAVADAALLEATRGFMEVYDEWRRDHGDPPYPLPQKDPRFASIVNAKELLSRAEARSNAAVARLDEARRHAHEPTTEKARG